MQTDKPITTSIGEGESGADDDFSSGYCVAGSDTAAFLENALSKLGLTRREANEFMVYWLPLMQDNPYNLIAFQSDVYTQNAQLLIDPVRARCCGYLWRGSKWVKQWRSRRRALVLLIERTGFTVVEWGGCQVR